MDADKKEEWCRLLESGDYPQGKEFLCQTFPDMNNKDGEIVRYCCLGVAAEMAVEAGIISKFSKNDIFYFGVTSEASKNDRLPMQVMQWLDPSMMGAGLGDFMLHTEEWDKFASILNDEGVSFVDIAKLIREQL